MQIVARGWYIHVAKWSHLVLEFILAVALVLLLITASASAAGKRLQERSLYANSTLPGATTYYKLSFRYMSADPVGSVELLFCNDPIPYMPCVTPTGMSVAGATLSNQSGETGFSIATKTTNKIVLSRTAVSPTDHASSYTFDGIVNPTTSNNAFAIRIKTFSSTNATGSQVDFGSVRGQVTEGIVIETQVPPMLIFCMAEEVDYNCTGTNENYYTEMGDLNSKDTLTAQSQMAVGTNASGGFVITANGSTMSAGTSTIQPLDAPTPSKQGTNQFGMNLVENSSPNIGADPEGSWTNAVVADNYNQRDKYMFRNGDIIAYSPNVSLMKKYTVSYVVNSSPELKAGVYTTTINFIASGRF